MKKIITITAIFVLAITLLTACRAGKEDMTTTGDRNTLPQTTGATITTPMDSTRPVETTRPSTVPTVPGTDDNSMPGTTDGTGTMPSGTTEPGTRGRHRGVLPGKY